MEAIDSTTVWLIAVMSAMLVLDVVIMWLYHRRDRRNTYNRLKR